MGEGKSNLRYANGNAALLREALVAALNYRDKFDRALIEAEQEGKPPKYPGTRFKA